MKRDARRALVLFTCAAALLAPQAGAERERPPPAKPRPACLCSAAVKPLEAFEAFDLIFFGEASFVGASNPADPESEDEFAEFSVEGVWKGPVQRRLRVHTRENDPLCAYTFTPGKRYLVYARHEDIPFSNRYRTSRCTRTAEASRALPDLAILGPPAGRPDELPEE